MSIIKTRDYGIFKRVDYNRKLDFPNLERIIASIKIKNMLHLRPIMVNSRMEVIDGQHRLEAAKKLGIDVFYQINETSCDEDMILLNCSQKGWSLTDYLNYYAKRGNENYINFLKFCEEHNAHPDLLKTVCFGRGHDIGTIIREGKMKFGDAEIQQAKEVLWKANEVVKLLERLSLDKGSFLRSSRMKLAIVDFLQIDDVDLDMFLRKISMKFDCFRPCATRGSYISMFKGIYNWKNPSPIQ